MKRREALKSLGFGVAAGLVLPAWLSSCSKEDEGPEIKYDGVVGIVGAGASGLAVADYLISKGIKVIVFEASERIGGRVRRASPSSAPVKELSDILPIELGADRIFGTDSEMGKIVRLLRVPTTRFTEKTNVADYYIVNDEYYAEGEISTSELQALENFKAGLASATGSVQDAANAAGLSAGMQGILNSWLISVCGSSSDRIDAKTLGEALDATQHDNVEFTLTTNPIGETIASRYDKAVKRVRLNSAVKTVDYTGESINLTILNTSDSSQTSETVTKLVVTCPVPVLKNSSLISFAPALPASKTSALSRIGMDKSIRVIMEFAQNKIFRKPETGNYPVFIYGGDKVPVVFFAGIGRSNTNLTVSITISGPEAEALTGFTDAQIIDHILDELDVVLDGAATANVRKYFPGEVPPDVDPTNPIIYIVKDWSKEVYIGGGQSYPMVGGTNEDRVALAEPIDDRIFFAGEAADTTGEFGTISGAIKAGEKAAADLAAVILEENETAGS